MNFEKTARENLPVGIIQPRRAQVYVGFQCHQGCGFCYYKSRCSEKMFNLDYIKKQVDFEYEYGIRDFEITGGEPSEFMELRELCEYIRMKSPNGKIAVITNGGLWNSDVWDLVDEVLLSYHTGKTETGLDRNMFPNGSSYKKAAMTVSKAKEHGVVLRTNTVIGKFNLSLVDGIVSDLLEFKPTIINFLPVNIFDESSEMISEIDYVALRPILKRQLDRIAAKLPETLVFVRYMPFCDMAGYEKHLVGHLQHIYDWFDWNVEIDGVNLLEKINGKPFEILGRYGSTSLSKCFSERNALYEKPKECMLCKYNIICDGVERNHGRLSDQVVPTRGSIVKNPLEYFGNQTEKLYKQIYEKH